jgi:hypothetical protein
MPAGHSRPFHTCRRPERAAIVPVSLRSHRLAEKPGPALSLHAQGCDFQL